MAAGFPAKADYATGDVLTAANMNDLSGTVNLINPSAKGDLYAGSAANTYTKLSVGANNTVLTADSSTATGLKWGTVASGGMTLLSTTSLTGATTTISSIDQTYTNLVIVTYGVTNATANGIFRIAPNGTTNIANAGIVASENGTVGTSGFGTTYIQLTGNQGTLDRTSAVNASSTIISNYASTTFFKNFTSNSYYTATAAGKITEGIIGTIITNTAISSLVFSNSQGNLSTGTVLLYGVK